MTENPAEPTPEPPASNATTIPAQEEMPPSAKPPSGQPLPGGPPPAAQRPRAPDLKTPSGARRIKYAILSPETRTGRFLRALLRALALIVGMFALGLLAGYLLLYRPAVQELNGAHLQATQTAGDLQKARQDLANTREDLQTAQDNVGKLQAQVDVEVARGQVLRALDAITLTRIAIQSSDKTAASKALDMAQGYLQAVQPTLEKRDAQQVTTLQALFTLAKNDLNRDLKLAGQDLDRLQSELERAEANVLK